MRFAIFTSNNEDPYKNGYKDILEPYHEKSIKFTCEWDEEKSITVRYIEIKDLDMLWELKTKIEHELILESEWFSPYVYDSYTKEPTIRIWDGYVE
jgi:hypothetical protein